MIHIREAKEADHNSVALCIAEGFKRIPEKHGKQKGFNEKIFMRYCRK